MLTPSLDRRRFVALATAPALQQIAEARGTVPAVVALAWTMRDGNTIALMQSGSSKHVREDAGALTFTLSQAEINAIDEAFPARAG